MSAKWCHFGCPGGAWGTILASFWGSGAPLGAPKGPIGASTVPRDVPLAPCRVPGGLLEGPWGALGGLLGGSLAHFVQFWTAKSYPKIDVEFVHFLGGLLERFRHPSTLKNKQNQWSVCTDHSFGLFSFSLFFTLFCVKNVILLGGKMVENLSKIQHGLKMPPKGHQRLPWGPFRTLLDSSWIPDTLRQFAEEDEGRLFWWPPPPQGRGGYATWLLIS